MNTRKGKDGAASQLDQIYTSNNLEVTQAGAYDTIYSDHLLTWVKLRIITE